MLTPHLLPHVYFIVAACSGKVILHGDDGASQLPSRGDFTGALLCSTSVKVSVILSLTEPLD